jgi:cell division topological specificity factor
MNQFLDRLLGRDQKSANLAKERMKLVLVHDRIDMTPSEIEDMKDELIEVISRHIEIDSRAVQIEMTQDGRQQRLLADIPLLPVRRRRVR